MAAPALAAPDPVDIATQQAAVPEQAAAIELERPGAEPPVQRAFPSPPTNNPGAIPLPPGSAQYDLVPVPDRWRIMDQLRPHSLLDPYNTNVLKGDKPFYGHDWFFNLSAISDTTAEFRTVPVPTGVATTSRPGTNDTFGHPSQMAFSQKVILSFDILKGATAFKPPEYEFRFTPVITGNYAGVRERGLLNADPTTGRVRRDSFVAVQDAFFDYHLGNISDRYDFASLRLGVQPFQADFRGFLFQDNAPGARLFGNFANNQYQYNVAWFDRAEKDTNSGLNDLSKPLRRDQVYVVNLYAQDTPVPGFTSQLTFLHNRNNDQTFHYNTNDFLVRPASIGDERARRYHVSYAGFNGDGHFGRVNLTTSFYYAFGRDYNNTFSGEPADIKAHFFAIEPSMDFDWYRVRLSALHASGARNPYGKTEGGFDAVQENPLFAGGETSYWIRQGIPLIGGGGVGLSGPNGVLPSLRSSKDEGQSNFINPGILLLGIGADFDVLPELRLSANLNHLRFDNTRVLEVLRNQGRIHKDIGNDLSVAATWRPFDTQNIIFRISGAVLFAGQGIQDLYSSANKTDRYYSVLTSLVLAY